jgi:RHS repeat-associated protein
MQLISTLVSYGKALSRKQIMLGFGLVALISIAGLAVADFLTAPVADTLSDQVGAIQADFKVNESGAATYNIKIYTPPGTAGVAPQVSLAYSSQGGNGVMGKGWSISATSGISRCRASREAGDFILGGVPVDGDSGPVNFTGNDRFCLDGQRMLEVSNTTDSCKVISGLTARSFRTEIESFQRVCAYTFNAANGPRFFTVERKDGSTSWYGDRVTNSTGEIGVRTDGFLESNRQLTDGTYTVNASIASWLQTRFQDSTGNYIDYFYLKNPTETVATGVTGELVLSEIKYTGKMVLPGQSGAASDPYASIKFNYGLASPVTTGYQSGSRFTQSQRLNSVTVMNDNEVVRYYPLTYVISGSGSGATLLSQIKECADLAAATCMQPTTFGWADYPNEFATTQETNTEVNWNDATFVLKSVKFGDINGDGRQDAIYIQDANVSRVAVALNVAARNTSAISPFSFPTIATQLAFPSLYVNQYSQPNPGDNGWFLLDYNGDGYDDLAANNGASWVIWPSNGTNGFNASVNLLANLPTPIPGNPGNRDPNIQPVISDINGDGLMDIVYFSGTALKVRLMEKVNGSFGWYTERSVTAPDVCLNIKNCTYAISGLFRKNGFQQLNDFNGDARSDLMLILSVTAASDSGILKTTGDISVPPAPGVLNTLLTKTMNFALTVDSVSATELSLKRYSWWSEVDLSERIQFADINGDMMQDLIMNSNGAIYYQINNGNGFRPLVAVSGSIPFANFKRTQMADVNGDGRIDLLYPRNDGLYIGKFVARLADINGNFMPEILAPGGNAYTYCGTSTTSCLDNYIYMFTDLDNEGSLDFLLIKIKRNDSRFRYVSKARAADEPRDLMLSIKDGLDNQIQVSYAALTNSDIYRQESSPRNVWTVGRGSPVQSFLAPIYAVKSVTSKLPTQADINNSQKVFYRYSGAKLQSGGRGLVGFSEITSFDTNYPNQTLATTTRYYQTFPFVGVPIDVTQRVIPTSSYNPTACFVGSCYAKIGQLFPALGGTVISRTGFAYESYPAFVPGQPMPTQVRTVGTDSETFDVSNALRISRVATAYNYDAWGNTLQTAVDTYTGSDNTNPVKLETTNVYVNDSVNWRLSRMTESNVTHRRNGNSIARYTIFDYDLAGTATGFLKAERISPNGASNQDMRKEYSLDVYGNRVASFSCSQGIVNCKSTTLDYSPWDVIRVHRYSRVEYDNRGRYVTGTFEPFNTPGQQWDSTLLTEYKTQTVLARDKYGEITHAKDVNGVSVVSQRSAMGRDYWSWVQTTPGATPGDPSQGIDSYKTYRYCGATTDQVLCPVAAKFREQIITDAAPKHWTYFDLLKRPVMEITQTFNEGVTGKDFSAVCKAYDTNGRPSFVSDPFFLSVAAFNGEPSFGLTDPCASRNGTYSFYDVLGRPTTILLSDASQTTSQYTGLITTTTNNLGQKKIEEKNALGELVKATDHLGFQTLYSYDAGGNLATVKRNAGRGDIVTTMQYDSLGRKIYMKDPDAGEWGYNYYPSGEMESQHNGVEGIYRLSRYDYRGRLVWSGTKNRNDVWESVNVTRFDTVANGVGQADCAWTDGSYQYRAWQGDSNKSNYWLECKQYDSMGRNTTTTTTIDDTTYSEGLRYDGFSRPYKRMDPTGQWIKTEFTPRGMSVRTCESSDADTNPNCASNVASTYVETLETNARGQVAKEQRGGTAALQVTRTYDDFTGALLRTCAGTACQIADENLQWDTIGNLKSRDITNQYREEYAYDGLNRLTESRFARLETTSYAVGSQPISTQQTYDALGNLCSKTIYGVLNAYSYAGVSGCGLNNGDPNTSPHAVQQVGSTLYSYDSHGNQIFADRNYAGGDRSIQYTANEQAYQITQGKYVTQFWYAPNNQRYKRQDIFYAANGSIDPPPPTGTTTTFAVSAPLSLFAASGLAAPVTNAAAPPGTPQITKTITIANLEIITAPNGVVTKRRTVAGVMLQETVSNVSVNRYLFHNHLGSVIRIAEANGSVLESFDYSPFGERRYPTAAYPNGAGYGSSKTNRGYTGHEMLDAFSIVHMNGRIYDSQLGRFLQADPMVEDPSNGQNFNRYTYVWNNPLAYTDPSGFMSVRSLFRAVAGVFIASYLPGASFWGGAANGALANISAGFIGGYIATGNLRGGLAGAFSNGVMYAGRQRAVEEAVVPASSNDSYVSGEESNARRIAEEGQQAAEENVPMARKGSIPTYFVKPIPKDLRQAVLVDAVGYLRRQILRSKNFASEELRKYYLDLLYSAPVLQANQPGYGYQAHTQPNLKFRTIVFDEMFEARINRKTNEFTKFAFDEVAENIGFVLGHEIRHRSAANKAIEQSAAQSLQALSGAAGAWEATPREQDAELFMLRLYGVDKGIINDK